MCLALLLAWPFRIVATVETVARRLSILPEKAASRRRITTEAAIKAFFGSNALVAIVVLTLITIFLFREGFGFFGQNLASLRLATFGNNSPICSPGTLVAMGRNSPRISTGASGLGSIMSM